MWLAITGSGNMDHYHLGTFQKKDECVKALSKAAVLKTNKSLIKTCKHWLKLVYNAIKPYKNLYNILYKSR